MRVLIVSHGHPAFSIGGAEMASHNLFCAINAADGHDAHYLARAAAPLRRHAETPLLALRQSEREVFLHADTWDPFWLSNAALDDLTGAFAQYITQVQPDIVHFHHVIGLGVEAILQVRRMLPDAAIVITFHEYLSICLNHGQMVKTTRNTLCRQASPAECGACFPQHAASAIFQRELFLKDHLALADAYVSPSRFLIQRYVDWGLPAEKFHFIENGLEPGATVAPRPLADGGRRNRFGFFGQVTEFKGLAVLLDAIARVPRSIWGDASLCIFGGNLENQPAAFRERFATLLEAAGRRARFFGSYRAEELPRLMQQVDWAVVPSIWWENSPLVIQEAFLHGRPPIVSDIGGMAEKVTHGVNGLQFRAGSPEDLADRLSGALREPALWQTLRDAAPRRPIFGNSQRSTSTFTATPLPRRAARPCAPHVQKSWRNQAIDEIFASSLKNRHCAVAASRRGRRFGKERAVPNILVISPSGEVYNHDCVRWYSREDFAAAPDHYHNIGDAFVYDSSLKLLHFDRVKAVNIRNPSDADIEHYNNDYDFAFLRGSNYLHPAMDWENAPAVLKRLRVPIVAFGIGAQAPVSGELQLTEATKQVLQIIAERSVSLGVRGAYTADVLWRHGIREARIIGCPTIFRNNDPNLRIDLPPLADIRRVAYTLRREVGHDYAQNVKRYLDLQRDTILDLSSRFELDVLAQGEVEEKQMLWGDAAQQDAARNVLRAQGWLHGPDDPMEALYRSRLFYADDVSAFEAKLRAQQFVLGFRLHGNLLGLANRVPSVYFTYDSRTTEFAETFNIPRFDVFGGEAFRLEDYWDQALFERFNRAYHERYRDMRLFLDENGVSHKMVAPAIAPRQTTRTLQALERAA